MSVYIRKSDAKKVIEDIDTWGAGWRDYACKIIDAFPAADVKELKHGQWLDATTLDNEFICYVCSECRHGADFIDPPYKFCPNCGAQMEMAE